MKFTPTRKWSLAGKHILGTYAWTWGAFIVLSLLAGCLPATVFYGLSYLIDHVPPGDASANAASDGFLTMLLIMMVALLGINILNQVQYLILDHLRDHIRLSVKQSFLYSILGEDDLASLENKKTVALLSDVTRSFENLGLWVDHVGTAIMSGSGVFFLVLLGFTLNWWLAPLLLLSAIPSAIIRYKVVDASLRIEESYADRYRHLSLLEKIMVQPAYFKEIRLFGVKDHLFSEWKNHAQECARMLSRSRISGIRKTFLTSLFSAIIATACTLYLARSVMTGDATVGSLAIIIGIILQLHGGLNFFVFSINRSHETARQVMPLFIMLDRFNKTKSNNASPAAMNAKPSRNPPQIKIVDMSYIYPDSRAYALRNIALTIDPGSKVAIVGENGAGKTTLIKLLAGLLAPTTGNIYVNGSDLTAMDKSEFWSGIGAVFQDHAKFPVSANLNVALGDIDRLQEQDDINACLKIAGLADLEKESCSNEKYYEEPFFSGGQWQRLALARALFRSKKTQFLILDEPTSALDPNVEHELFEHFLDLARGKTTIFVTHRLSLAREADIILVLDQGRIAEAGSHDQLISNSGLYSVMFERQASRFADCSAPMASVGIKPQKAE